MSTYNVTVDSRTSPQLEFPSINTINEIFLEIGEAYEVLISPNGQSARVCALTQKMEDMNADELYLEDETCFTSPHNDIQVKQSHVAKLAKKMRDSASKLRKNTVQPAPRYIDVHVLCMRSRRTIVLDTHAVLELELQRNGVSVNEEWWYTHGVHPLRLQLTGLAHGINHGDTLVAHRRLLGGAQQNLLLPTYSHVKQCETQVMFETMFLQSDEELAQQSEFVESMLAHVSTFKTLFTEAEPMVELLESLFQSAYWFRKCETVADYTACAALSYKLILGKGVSTSFMKLFHPTNDLQGSFEDCTSAARRMFELTTASLSNPLVDRMRKLYTYLLVQGFLKHVGMEMSDEEFMTLERKARVEYRSETGLLILVIDTAILVCERICAYRATGDWMNLVHTDAAYTAWFKEADRLIGLGPFTSNLEAVGTTYFTFFSDLTSCIEKGEAYCKFTKKTLGTEMTALAKKLASLRLLKNLDLTKRAAQKERKAPFGVLIHGSSSVAKSTFTKSLFYYFGGVHGLNTEDHYMFARSPTDEYWSNFDPSMWAIRIDDAALLDPSKSTDVDPTVRDIINVVNNVPYVPPQAAVEDKGKTPVLAKLVLVTTNTPSLNASEYFACPLAVRRRLPLVVNIRPKEEYLAANKQFIDPARLPAIEDDFPDYWIITVQKQVIVQHNGKEDVRLQDDKIFTSMRDFLKYFAEVSVEHSNNQTKSELCDNKMSEIKVCRLCYETTRNCACVQADITMYGLMLYYLRFCVVDWLFRFLLELSLNMLSFTFMYYAMRLSIVRRYNFWLASWMDRSVQIRVWGLFFANKQDRIYTLRLRQFLQVLKMVTTVYLSWQASRYAWKKTFPAKQEDPKEQKHVEEDTTPLEPQGNVYGTTEDQLAKEEASNVWYNPTVELNRFDVPLASQSLTGLRPEQIRDILAQNCVRLEFRDIKSGKKSRVGGVFVRGHWLMFNRHALMDGEQYELTILSMTQSQGLTSNTKVRFKRLQVRENVSRDLAMLEVRDVPPRKDILKLWCETNIPVSKLVSVRRDKSGAVLYQEVHGVTYEAAFPVESLGQEMALYLGKVCGETQVGDCGSLAVAITPRGPVILGVHTLGYMNTAGYTHILRSDISDLMGEGLVVTAGPEPQFSLQGSVHLTEPHHRSLMRYVERGTLVVYGSMPGFRAKPRSKVCSTPLQKEMLDHFETQVKHCEPFMIGYAPWRNNLVEMVVPNHDIDADIIDQCSKSFLQDILKGLRATHGDEWKRELLFLSKRASLNGLPGVKFIDRVNVNSSMGSPFNTTKKAYLVDAPCETYPDGIDFDPIVWDMYDAICESYARGERVNPVFMGHLKDEPVTFAKREAKKTRLFTGAPVAWCLVVRSRCLAMVRLIQQNPFVFEAGPGTVAQSTAWGAIRDYLVAHGEDRIVAGDYSKFDKRMVARFVLAAFDVIIGIMREAGFSEAELREIQCIAEDTAFPVVNVNGDVVEFFGTNPSGHPLTVIINSLVNSIYMRYAYVLANPARECVSFKQNVNLFTYGDDNIMGVSPECEWFNHTAIQAQLATIGVQYTMADKEAETKPFINIAECSFLKRSWRFDSDVGAFLCPLEEESIHKSLTVWTPSNTLSPEEQMVMVISSANSEYFFYGREVFEKHHAFFKEILEREPFLHYVKESTLPGWDLLNKRFWKASEGNQDSTR